MYLPTLKKRPALVEPELLKCFLHVINAGPDSDAVIAELAEAQEQRRAALQKRLEAPVVLIPIQADLHWTLLCLVKNADAVEVRYFDTLHAEKAACREVAQQFLAEMLPGAHLPPRMNCSRQAGATCGCYVLQYMEQMVREHCRGEAPGSLGWPKSQQWADRVVQLVQQLQAEKAAQEKDSKKAAEKEAKDLKKATAGKAAAVEAKASAAGTEALAKSAAAALEKKPPGAICRENLSAAAQENIKHVELHGAGVCGRCKWSSGCSSCHGGKALQYWLKKEFGHLM